MQIKLSLSEEGNLPFFFLGEDLHNLKVQLTFEKPGPVDVVLEDLTEQEQAVLFRDLVNKKLVCDLPIQELYNFFRSMQGQKSLEKVAEKTKVDEETVNAAKKALLQEVQKRQQQKSEVEDRIQYIVKKGVKAVLAALKDVDDYPTLLAYQRAEVKEKKRATVLSYIETKLSRFNKQIHENIENSEGNTNLFKPLPSTQYDNSVIESDEELVQFAAGKPLVR